MSFYSNLISWLPGLLIFTLAIALLNSSTRIINEGNQALVERMGKYSRTLDSGINFIFPIFEYTVLRDSIREQNLPLSFFSARTKEGIHVELDLDIIWQIKDLRKTFYAVENVELCLSEIVEHTVANKISLLDREEIKPCEFDYLKEEINGIVEKWGIAVTHLFFHGLGLPADIIRAESARQVQRIQEGMIAEVSREVQNIDKKAEDAGIKTPENAADFERILKDALKTIAEIRTSPKFDLRGAYIGGGLADWVQGSQIGGAINGDNQISYNPSSQLSRSDLYDRDVDQEERGESLTQLYASEPELNTNADQGRNE
jgi:regulator of protease activity HflC (stomatin/prohibitin superfamily)